MRNLDEEIKQLEKDIKNLELTKEEKKAQLELIKKKQREIRKTESVPIQDFDRVTRDYYGKPILVGDWVRVTRKGKFNETEGIVVRINKWVTFEDRKVIKQCRISHNLIVSDSPATYHVVGRDTNGKPKHK